MTDEPEKTHLTLEDWAKLQNKLANVRIIDLIDTLTATNELLALMPPLKPYPWHRRFRQRVANFICSIAFRIDPDARDDYY